MFVTKVSIFKSIKSTRSVFKLISLGNWYSTSSAATNRQFYADLKDIRLGFIGGGTMATAMVSGFVKSGQIKPQQISVSAPADQNMDHFKQLGCFTTNINNDIFKDSSSKGPVVPNSFSKVLFLCIKPNAFNAGFGFDLNQLVKTSGAVMIVSVMAGITIEHLEQKLGTNGNKTSKEFVRYARLMPNTAVSLCAGICGLSVANTSVDPQFKEFLAKLLSPIGWCEFIDELQMNAVCGLGGSGIAFVYSLIHAMSDGGLKMGLPRSVATNFAAQTVLGAALMVIKTEKNSIALRDEVTSPGGTTIYGIHALEKGGFNSVIIDAIEKATERANQFS